jgi:superfamily I DNA/RNA helicase
MRRYEERLQAYRAADFDDLVVLPMRLLAEHDDVRDAWRDGCAISSSTNTRTPTASSTS